ncbi:MAG TPA: ABC transporter permease [Gaiellaceae bacterium]|jgi:ABC-type dipeptide/oligopeptide/nickel transport system permease subunit
MSELVEAGTATTRREPRRVIRGRTFRRLLQQPAAVGAAIVLAFLFVVGALVPHFAPNPKTVHLGHWANHAPLLSGWHILGTDALGRDMLVRTLYGLHTSEQSALLATLIASVVGIVLGGIAGYRGGWLDSLIMRFGDMFGVLPALMLLLIAYTYFLPVTVGKATLIFAFYFWIPVARVVRAEIASLRPREFVQAALSLGASDRRIFFRHLLPNGSSTIIVAATTVLGEVIVLEAMLEFFNVGVPSAVTPTLGNLIGDAQSGSLAYGLGWWTLVTPAGVLILLLVCVNLLGDGLAEALRPARTR